MASDSRSRVSKLEGSMPASTKCCVLEQDTLSILLGTGFYPGRPENDGVAVSVERKNESIFFLRYDTIVPFNHSLRNQSAPCHVHLQDAQTHLDRCCSHRSLQ